MAPDPGHGSRTAIARIVGVVAGIATAAVMVGMFRGAFNMLAAERESAARLWLLIAFVALVFGSSASAFTRWFLTRRARARAERDRLPVAKVLDR